MEIKIIRAKAIKRQWVNKSPGFIYKTKGSFLIFQSVVLKANKSIKSITRQI